MAQVTRTLAKSYFNTGDTPTEQEFFNLIESTAWFDDPVALTVNGIEPVDGDIVLTTANVADSANKRYVTDADLLVLAATSGTNTGDETLATIKTKLGAASGSQDGYLTAANWTTFNAKQSALVSGTNIKTVNGNSLLGSGDLVISGSGNTFSTGLTDTAGTITSNLSTGVAGGQSVIGGNSSGNNLTLSSTSNATKGKLLFGTSAYDESGNRLGIGTTSPGATLQVNGAASGIVSIFRANTTTPGNLTEWQASDGTPNLLIDNTYQLSFRATASLGGGPVYFGTFNQPTGSRAGFSVPGNVIMGIDASNLRVGFGGATSYFATTNPSALVHVRGKSNETQFIVQANGTQTSNLQEWQNSSGTVLASVSSGGNLGIGIAPTACLHLKAGTAAANTAPLKFTAGTLLTTPENYTFEVDASGVLYWTTGGVRKIVNLT